jgi:hypothetical protein
MFLDPATTHVIPEGAQRLSGTQGVARALIGRGSRLALGCASLGRDDAEAWSYKYQPYSRVKGRLMSLAYSPSFTAA